MIQEESETTTLPFSRPLLKRSKTIVIGEIRASNPKTIYKHDGNSFNTPPEQPKSSCQALKHAVSALTRIDDFHLEELGSGFFANVYKATHYGTKQEMVMKINKDIANRHCALREVQLMKKMSHPNILRFLGVCVHEGQLHSLTEFISGGNLEELLANKSEELPWTLRIKISLDIARGLGYIHELGYIHRDLTSRNVLIKKEEHKNYTAVIADFGLSTKIPDPQSTTPLVPVGSPWWIAPEVLKAKFYDERSDLFSFGIINMELTARIESDPDVMPRTHNFGVDYHKICELVDYCPLDFLQLSFRCCQIQPERRPNAKVIQSSLEKIYKNLSSDSFTRKGHKRSKSEDNILQANDSYSEDGNLMTAEGIAQVMSADDPDYSPDTSPAHINPFASIGLLKYGHKLVDFHPRRVSTTSPIHKSARSDACSFFLFPDYDKQESLSLPSSPLMLRKAAIKMHQISLHGSDAVKIENKHELRLCTSSDVHTSSRGLSVADREIQFRSNRTRSLNSLDFFSSQTSRHHPVSDHSDLTSLSNNCNKVLRESSYEDILSCEMEEDNLDNEDSLNDFCFNNSNCVSLASESYKTALSCREVEEENTDVSDTSLSSCSISSFNDSSEKVTKTFAVEREREHNINYEDKTLISLQNKNYDRNQFGNVIS